MPIPTFVFDVAELPEAQQFTAWASHVANSRASRPVDHGPFRCRTRFWTLEPLLISEQDIDAFTFDRDEAMVRATPADHYSLVVVLDGVLTFKRADGDIEARAGDACLTDLTRPELMQATAQHSVTIQVARWFLDEAVSPRDAHGPLPRTPAVAVLVDFVRALVAQLAELEPLAGQAMARVVRDLLAAAIADMPPRPEAPANHLPIRHRVRGYMASEPMGSITLDGICDRLGVTRSSLHRAFKADGGVLAYDRRRRLVALHDRLTDPTEMRSVAELGYAYGFPEKTHLSRAFRAAFGYAPSDLRRNAAAAGAALRTEPDSLPALYKAALRSLS